MLNITNQIPIIDANHIIIKHDEPAINAVKVIDTSDSKIALVMDENGRLVGSATDGDIRRGLLKGYTLDSNISIFMHQEPVVLPATATRQQILDAMHNLDVKQIPLVCDDGKIVGLTSYSLLQGMAHIKRSNPVVIMAGGKGKRLMPITKDIPKSMVEVGGRPILELIIQRFRSHGFHNFYLSINHLGNIIEEHFKDGSEFGCEITYLRENQRLGTAGALSFLPASVVEDFIVINGDILSSMDFGDMLDSHLAKGNSATICTRTHRMEVPYGVLRVNDAGLVETIIEKPVYENLISAGIYAINPEALTYIKENTFTDMPNLLMTIAQDGHKISTYSLQEEWIDIGRHDDLERARKIFVEKNQ